MVILKNKLDESLEELQIGAMLQLCPPKDRARMKNKLHELWEELQILALLELCDEKERQCINQFCASKEKGRASFNEIAELLREKERAENLGDSEGDSHHDETDEREGVQEPPEIPEEGGITRKKRGRPKGSKNPPGSHKPGRSTGSKNPPGSNKPGPKPTQR